jgi:hypothetical protein
MPTASPVAAIAKLNEELIALEDKYGAPNRVLHFENIKYDIVFRLTLGTPRPQTLQAHFQGRNP